MPPLPTMACDAGLPLRHGLSISSHTICRRRLWSWPTLHPEMSRSHSIRAPHICSLKVSRAERIVTVTLMRSRVLATSMSFSMLLSYIRMLLPMPSVS